MLSVSKQDPSAKNRYIYYEDMINTLPNSLSTLLFKQPPVFRSVIKSILQEPFVEKGDGQDESLYSFVARRFNDHVALNLVGAITHGIYAGDAKQLSVKSTMRMLYDNEQIHGSVVQGMLKGGATVESSAEKDIIDQAGKVDTEWFDQTRKASVFGFKEGSETLTRKLKQWLKQQPNVTLLVDKQVRKIKSSNDGNSIKVKERYIKVHDCP
jgi:oxygen-dependent protoporphyrinogen oxidase